MPHGDEGSFWVFFNEIMQGKLVEKSSKCSYLSEATITQIQEKITKTTYQSFDQNTLVFKHDNFSSKPENLEFVLIFSVK